MDIAAAQDLSKQQLRDLLGTAYHNQEKIDRLQEAELKMLQADSINNLFHYLFEVYPKTFQLQSFTLLLIDENYALFRLLEDSDESASQFPNLQLCTSDEEVERIKALGETLHLTAYNQETHHWLLPRSETSAASLAILPMIRHQKLIGIACCISDDSARFQPSMGTDFMRRLASILGISIENALNYHRLQYFGLTDALTGVRNRRFLDQRLIEEIARAQRNNEPLSFLFIDIDHFKQVNDQYGHHIGDQALNHTASAIASQLRRIDLLARYGGEEFAVLLSNTNIREATHIAERIRAKIQDSQIEVDDIQLAVTASIGLAELSELVADPNNDEPATTLTTAADTALYEAKESGRNLVCQYQLRIEEAD